MCKLSCIVPVYNVEQYLRKCVCSLIHQDFADYEVILVDDGSTDDSGKICDELSESISDERLAMSVIHQPNAGLSAARNSGIEKAKGRYVLFVDSDDYLEPNVLGALMAQVERERLDVLHFDYQNVRINSAGQYEVFQPYKFPHPVDDRTDVVSGERYMAERMGYGCYACHFVINREVTGTFTPGIHFEDTEWLPRMMLAAKRVNSTTKVVYNYFWREGSITQTQGNKEKIRKNIDDEMVIIERYRKYSEQYPDCKWLRNMQGELVSGVLTTVARDFYSERKEYIKRLKNMNVFPLTIANQGKTYMRRAVLINLLGARAYCALMHTMYR